MRLRPRWFPLPSVLVAAVFLALPAPAQAGTLLSTALSCEEEVLSQPFQAWGDSAQYTPVPGGSFETDPSGWTLSGGAALADGNEPFYVNGAGDGHSLSLPAGSTATSRALCIGVENPTLRLFTRRTPPNGSTLRIEVLYEDADGNLRSLPLQQVPGSTSWEPTNPIALVVNWMTQQSGNRTAVAFRFTPQGPAGWSIDDVYVDPWRGR